MRGKICLGHESHTVDWRTEDYLSAAIQRKRANALCRARRSRFETETWFLTWQISTLPVRFDGRASILEKPWPKSKQGLPFLGERVTAGPELLLDTFVHMDGLQGRDPDSVADLQSTFTHAACPGPYGSMTVS